MSTWRERLKTLDEARWESERSRANPHHGPSQRTWVESAVDENGWGMMTGGPVIRFENSTEGGRASGLKFDTDRRPPAGAVQFARDVWLTGEVNREVSVYMVSEPAWEHAADRSPCAHGGPSVPPGEWVTMPVPFTCAEGLAVYPRQSSESFWMDDLLP